MRTTTPEEKRKIRAIMAKIRKRQQDPGHRAYPGHRLNNWQNTAEYIRHYRWANLQEARMLNDPRRKQFNEPAFKSFVNIHGEVIA